MDLIIANNTDKKQIENIINSQYLTMKEHPTKDIFRIGKKGVQLTAKKEYNEKGFTGYSKLDIKLKPHYYFNNDFHNGNMMTLSETIDVIKDISDKLNISKDTYFRPTSLEFGQNLIPETFDTKDIVTQSLYWKKKPLLLHRNDWQYYKTTKPPRTKEERDYTTIYNKIYHKGKQFEEMEFNDVHPNTLRYEIGLATHSKLQSTIGVSHFSDFTNPDTYRALGNYLIDCWNYVLLLDEINEENAPTNPNYYDDIKHFRNGLNNARKEYYKTAGLWHKELKELIKYTIREKYCKMQILPLIDSWNPHKIPEVGTVRAFTAERICRVTGLDISMQKEISEYVCTGALRYYHSVDAATFQFLTQNYLINKGRNGNIEEQFYYIAHNIRNRYFNKIHNRRRFEERNYPPNQLQLF